ncbi:hypothetical protein M8818_006086 [Zalaria obscura]|uniref:Uncharacterized protein n=1 Tax=Zalaria obscura TaxID=2024903 RepID=A0ACC3S7W0_9PEZI
MHPTLVQSRYLQHPPMRAHVTNASFKSARQRAIELWMQRLNEKMRGAHTQAFVTDDLLAALDGVSEKERTNAYMSNTNSSSNTEHVTPYQNTTATTPAFHTRQPGSPAYVHGFDALQHLWAQKNHAGQQHASTDGGAIRRSTTASYAAAVPQPSTLSASVTPFRHLGASPTDPQATTTSPQWQSALTVDEAPSVFAKQPRTRKRRESVFRFGLMHDPRVNKQNRRREFSTQATQSAQSTRNTTSPGFSALDAQPASFRRVPVQSTPGKAGLEVGETTHKPRRSNRLAGKPARNVGFYATDAATAVVDDPATRSGTPQKHAWPVPKPTAAYLNQANKPYHRMAESRRLLVVLDLNGVLVHRKKGTRGYKERPGLRPFLDYIFSQHHVMVWSSGMPENVLAICKHLFSPEHFNKLIDIWGRDTLGLPPALYAQKVQVYKQLSWVWGSELVQASASKLNHRWDQTNTVLIDDSALKAVTEPFNLIQVDDFKATPEQMEEGVDVLGQVAVYLEKAKWMNDVSAFMRAHKFIVN